MKGVAIPLIVVGTLFFAIVILVPAMISILINLRTP